MQLQVLCPGRPGIWSFYGGRKTGEPEEKPSTQGENQQQAQRTYYTGLESNPGLIGGRRALLPLPRADTTEQHAILGNQRLGVVKSEPLSIELPLSLYQQLLCL